MRSRRPTNRSRQDVLRPFAVLFFLGVALALSGGLLQRFSVPQIWALIGAAMMLASCAVALKEWICALAKARGRGSD